MHCVGGGEGTKERQYFLLPEDVREKVYGGTLLSTLTSRHQPAVGRAKLSEIRQRKSNHNLVPCYCYC